MATPKKAAAKNATAAQKKPVTKSGTPKRVPPPKWTLSEILYLWNGWLTTRKAPIVLSSNHEAGTVADLLAGFLKANRIPGPRDHYPKAKIPDIYEHFTNVNSTSNLAAEPARPEKVIKGLLNQLTNLELKDQNIVIAAFLQELQQNRRWQIKRMIDVQNDTHLQIDNLTGSVDDLEKIGRGDFVVLEKYRDG